MKALAQAQWIIPNSECTNSIGQNLATVMADDFQQFLCPFDESWMVDWAGQFDVSEMPWAL